MADQRTGRQNVPSKLLEPTERKPVYSNPEGRVVDERDKTEQFDEIMKKENAVGDERTAEEKDKVEKDQAKAMEQYQPKIDAQQEPAKQELPKPVPVEVIRDSLRQVRVASLDMPNSQELAAVLEGIAQAERAMLALDDLVTRQQKEQADARTEEIG